MSPHGVDGYRQVESHETRRGTHQAHKILKRGDASEPRDSHWVADGTYSWAAIEGSKKLQLSKEMFRAHKREAKLSREKLF